MEQEYEKLLKEYKQSLDDNKELIRICQSFSDENTELYKKIRELNATLKKYHDLCINYRDLVEEQQKQLCNLIERPKTFSEVYYETIREILS